LIEVFKNKNKNNTINFEKFINLLNLFSPYSRKTLGRINNLLKKRGLNININDSVRLKRFEKLTWEDIFILIL
jgi:hypothetical protein